ncbi:MAG: hypothetical protein SFX18_01155 [Pirellulales bacterium]|nr:hypothetical protein [Pirellulales bacterium]
MFSYQLREADYTAGGGATVPADEHYETDLNGNRFERGVGTSYYRASTINNNQVRDDGVYEYTYDAEGNRLTRFRLTATQGAEDNYVFYYYDPGNIAPLFHLFVPFANFCKIRGIIFTGGSRDNRE